MSTFVFTSNDLVTELASMDLGAVAPGRENYKLFGVKNDSSNNYSDVTLTFFPNHLNNVFVNDVGTPIVSADIIKMATDETMQKTDVGEETAGGLLTHLANYRGKCFEYDTSGATWTDYSTGAVTFLDASTKYTYFGSDHIFFNLYVNPTQAGNYTGLTFEYWNGTAWTALPGDAIDGTTGLSVEGIIFFGSLTAALWKKKRLENATTGYNTSMYWIRVKATAVTTEAIATNVYWKYCYEAPYKFWYGSTRTFYELTDDATPLWNEVTPDSEYPMQGIFAFHDCPLTDEALHELRATYSYKNPQDGVYALTFPSVTSCSVNSGGAVTVVADGETQNTNIIEGMAIVLSADLTITDEATITIDDGVAYVSFAEDTGTGPGTWQNEDYNLGAIDAGNTESVYIGIFPPSTKSTADNYPYFKPFVVGDGV